MGWCAPRMQRCTARLSVQDSLCRLLQLRLANRYRTLAGSGQPGEQARDAPTADQPELVSDGGAASCYCWRIGHLDDAACHI